METAKKGDLKAKMLKAKMMKGSKGETAKQTPLPSLTAQPMGAMGGLSASQPEMGGVSAVQPSFKIPKPKREGMVELFGETEVQEYSPVKSYIKKRGMK
jgi:hypothetical protein